MVLPEPIVRAAQLGDEAAVLAWLDGGGDIDEMGANRATALTLASLCGREHLVLLLLERGADVNRQGARLLEDLAERLGCLSLLRHRCGRLWRRTSVRLSAELRAKVQDLMQDAKVLS